MEWRTEQDRGLRAIEEHQAANQSSMEQGVRILELARRLPELFARQAPGEKRRLLNFLLSNCTWKVGELRATFRHPFDLIAAAASAPESRTAAGAATDGRSENWLPFIDSYRTLCQEPRPEVKAVFESLRRLALTD